MRPLLRLLAAFAMFAGLSSASAQPTGGGGTLFGLPAGSEEVATLIGAGLGFSNLSGGEEDGGFLAFTLQPEVAFGNVGVGLAATLRYDVEGEGGFRREDYDEARDFIGIIQYVRYGYKGAEGPYGQLGRLDAAQLGNGQQVGLYRNEVALDVPQRGIVFDLDAGAGGFETLFGSIADPGVYGARGFFRPLRLGGGEGPAVIGALEVGVSVAGDLNEQGNFVNRANPGEPFVLAADSSEGGTLDVAEDDGSLTMVGFDLSLPFLSGPGFSLAAYADYNKILNYGQGAAAGLALTMGAPQPGATRLDARLEARYLGEQYLPNYFNAFYEAERIGAVFAEDSTDSDSTVATGLFNSRQNLLLAKDTAEGGIAAILQATFLDFIRLTGSYQQAFALEDSGWLHFGADVGSVVNNQLVARAAYDRWGLGGGDNLFQIADRNALLSADIGYKPIPYLLLGLHYERSFAPLEPEGSDEVIGYIAQEVLEPIVQLLVTF